VVPFLFFFFFLSGPKRRSPYSLLPRGLFTWIFESPFLVDPIGTFFVFSKNLTRFDSSRFSRLQFKPFGK